MGGLQKRKKRKESDYQQRGEKNNRQTKGIQQQGMQKEPNTKPLVHFLLK